MASTAMKPTPDDRVHRHQRADLRAGIRRAERDGAAAILAGGVISVQVLNEFAAVLRRKFRLEWDVIADALADVRTALGPVRLDVEIHRNAVSLARSHGFSLYDALIVASAFAAGCDTLLTENLQAGQRVGGLSVVNPFA